MTRLGTRLGRTLGRAARALGVDGLAVRAAARILRRLDPAHPALAVVPDGPPSYASGRADLQVTHRPAMPRESVTAVRNLAGRVTVDPGGFCTCWSSTDPARDCAIAAHRDAAARLMARNARQPREWQ